MAPELRLLVEAYLFFFISSLDAKRKARTVLKSLVGKSTFCGGERKRAHIILVISLTAREQGFEFRQGSTRAPHHIPFEGW